jgi:L-galactose dehydrogenase
MRGSACNTANLGNADLAVSQVGFGTAPLGELFGPNDEQSAIRLVDEALDLGITYVDTSRYYGSAEERK